MMHYLQFFVHFILHLNEYLSVFTVQYGFWVYLLLFLIIFCETGIVVAAFLPGDSLLFAAGAIAASGALNVYVLLFSLITAAFVGNTINYWVGKRLGAYLFRHEDSRIFKKTYLDKTRLFYEKHGAKTMVISCFLPIIRTFAAFVAGMSHMNNRKFILYNFVGVCFWMFLLIGGSYLFGNIPFVKQHFSFIIMAIIFVSLLPPIVEYLRARLQQ